MVSVPEWVSVQLPCSHINSAKRPWVSENIKCAQCQLTFSAPFAVECREWKVSCTRKRCPLGRFFGQSKDDAHAFANAHLLRTGHNCSVAYQFNPVTKGAVSAAYGRKTKVCINTKVAPKPLTGYQVIGAQIRGKEESDAPPF